MARTVSQKRYRRQRLKTLNAGEVSRAEREILCASKRKLGRTWLQLIYIGLGLRREDVLNAIASQGQMSKKRG